MKTVCILFICILSLSACHKTPHYAIDAGLKAAFNYKIGTYWIYKDSISGIVDSFYVNGNTIGQGTTDNYTFDYIYIYIVINNHVNNDSNTSWQLNLSMNTCLLRFFNQYNNFENNVSTEFLYPFKIGVSTSGIDSITNLLPIYSLGLQNFSNIAEIHTINNSPSSGSICNDWYYVCASSGFVKIILNHPQDTIYKVWELQRYNIVY